MGGEHGSAETPLERFSDTCGMIPKIQSCITVVQNGVEAVVIIDGQVPHAVLLELFTEHGAGTLLGKSHETEAGVTTTAEQPASTT